MFNIKKCKYINIDIQLKGVEVNVYQLVAALPIRLHLAAKLNEAFVCLGRCRIAREIEDLINNTLADCLQSSIFFTDFSALIAFFLTSNPTPISSQYLPPPPPPLPPLRFTPTTRPPQPTQLHFICMRCHRAFITGLGWDCTFKPHILHLNSLYPLLQRDNNPWFRDSTTHHSIFHFSFRIPAHSTLHFSTLSHLILNSPNRHTSLPSPPPSTPPPPL
nr:hypothetical protein HmN_000864500 [Hymenolepis microstoma]